MSEHQATNQQPMNEQGAQWQGVHPGGAPGSSPGQTPSPGGEMYGAQGGQGGQPNAQPGMQGGVMHPGYMPPGYAPAGVSPGGPGPQVGQGAVYGMAGPAPAPGFYPGGGYAHHPVYANPHHQYYAPPAPMPGYGGIQPGMAAHAGHGRNPGISEVMEELSNGGNGLSSLGKMLDFDDKDFWKGALLGAAVVLLLTNESVQDTLFRTGAKAKEKVKSGVDKVREKVHEATEKKDAGTEGK